jgi:hypothetical protein
MARKKQMSVSQVYDKLLKRREALQKDIDNSGDPLVVKPAKKALASLMNKIKELRDLQQSKNGNNGEEAMKYGGKMPMYPGGKTYSRRMRNVDPDMYPVVDRSDEYLSPEQIQANEQNMYGMNVVDRGTTTSNPWSTATYTPREEPPSPMPMRTTNQRYMSPGQAPIVNRDASYYGMDPEWTTPPESRERGLGANYGDYLTMGAKMLPIASDILDATRDTDYQKAMDFPYKQALLRRRKYIEDPRKVEAVTRGREDYRKSLRDATGGSAQQYLLGSLAGDVEYGQAEAGAIAEAGRDRAKFEQAEDARIAGALGQLGEFEVNQQMMEEDERRRAEAARRGFRRGATEKVAGLATAEEEKAYQMGALRDLYANFDYDEKTKRWVPKNMA